MKKLMLTCVAMGFLLTGMRSIAHADFYEVEVNKIGSTYVNNSNQRGAENINDNEFVIGHEIISWYFDVLTPGQAILSIVAEGVDYGEIDKVYFNNNYLGDLTHQGFYSGSLSLNTNIGGFIQGITALTTSVFDVSSYIESGFNTVRIEIDSPSWVNQIETSTLIVTPVPEPTTLLLFATGLAGLAAAGRRKRN